MGRSNEAKCREHPSKIQADSCKGVICTFGSSAILKLNSEMFHPCKERSQRVFLPSWTPREAICASDVATTGCGTKYSSRETQGSATGCSAARFHRFCTTSLLRLRRESAAPSALAAFHRTTQGADASSTETETASRFSDVAAMNENDVRERERMCVCVVPMRSEARKGQTFQNF